MPLGDKALKTAVTWVEVIKEKPFYKDYSTFFKRSNAIWGEERSSVYSNVSHPKEWVPHK